MVSPGPVLVISPDWFDWLLVELEELDELEDDELLLEDLFVSAEFVIGTAGVLLAEDAGCGVEL